MISSFFLHNLSFYAGNKNQPGLLSIALRFPTSHTAARIKIKTFEFNLTFVTMFKRLGNILTQGFPPKPTFTENNLGDLSAKVS